MRLDNPSIKGSGPGSNTISSDNAGANNYVNRLPEKGGVFAMTDDIANSRLESYTTTITATGTTTLLVSSNYMQYFTGTLGQIIVLPVVSTLVLGFQFKIVNKSTTAITVNSSGSNLVISLLSGREVILTCVAITGTDAASWSVEQKLPALTTDYLWTGVAGLPVETPITNIISGKATLISGQCTVIDTGITTNSYAIIGMSTVGVSTSVPIKFTPAAGSMVFTTGQATDTCDFGYIIFL